MTEAELVVAICARIADPGSRIVIKTVPPPPLFSKVDAGELDKTEYALGMKLPTFLRRLYSEVGNGGFGPGAGMLGVEGGYQNADGKTLVPCYLEFRSWGWPEGLLPLWDWGGNGLSCVDALSSDARIVTQDESGSAATGFTLLSWLDAWVHGVDLSREIFEMENRLLTNPFTHERMIVECRGRAKRLI